MATLISLPLEIFYQLSEVKCFRDSLLNLRLTCRTLNTQLCDIHLDKLYHTQNIFLSPVFLQNFLDISRDTSAPHLRARRFTISTYIPKLKKVGGAFEGEVQYGPADGIRFLSADSEVQLRPKEVRDLIRMECDTYDHTMAIRQIRDGRHRQPTDLLASLFSLFPRLESIAVVEDDWYPLFLSSFEFNIFYPSLDFGPLSPPSAGLKKYASNWMIEVTDISSTWWMVLHSLQLFDSTKIKSVTMGDIRDGGYGAIDLDTSMSLPSRGDSTLNIRELDIITEPTPYTDEVCDKFGKWLGIIGSRLEYLNLDLNAPEKFFLPTSLKLSNLKSLRLANAIVDFDNVKALLKHSRLTLQNLRIDKFKFDGGDSEMLFQFTKYSRRTLSNLKFLFMDIETQSDSNGFAVHISAHGWGPSSICSGSIKLSEKYVEFFALNLGGHVDSHYRGDDFWESLAKCGSQDFPQALRMNHDDGESSDYNDEDDDSDDDYDPSGTSDNKPETDDDSEYWSSGESDSD
ncbi:hypothetical protein TWF481_004989 [Arthrobotrys musiformis]|uniref:F-box domain-containing protein n=1 Tax=Arthrobotrys musiformis TaxID=47236 RepID=A0AAV9WNA3_9PEZI